MTPQEVATEAEVSKEVGLSPSLEFKNVKLSGGQIYMKAVKFTELTPAVTAFGKQDSVAGWEYSATPSRPEVRGNREGFIILMSPKEAQIRVAVDVQARVSENFLMKIFNRSKKWTDQDFVEIDRLELSLTQAVPLSEHQLQSRFQAGFADTLREAVPVSAAVNAVVLPPG